MGLGEIGGGVGVISMVTCGRLPVSGHLGPQVGRSPSTPSKMSSATDSHGGKTTQKSVKTRRVYISLCFTLPFNLHT